MREHPAVEGARREAAVRHVDRRVGLGVEPVQEQAQRGALAGAHIAGEQGEAGGGEREVQAGQRLVQAAPAEEQVRHRGLGEREGAETEVRQGLRQRGGHGCSSPSAGRSAAGVCDEMKLMRPAFRERCCSSWL